MGLDLETVFDIDEVEIDLEEDFDEDERWCLTPKGLFVIALEDAGLIEDINDKRVDAAWTIFDLLMEKHGYIHDDENNELKNKLP